MASVYRSSTGQTGFMIALFSMVAIAPASARPVQLVTAISALDHNFTCPEFLPDDAARQADLAAFGQALAAVGPRRLTLADATSIRIKLLARHHCYDTLAAIGQPVAMGAQSASQSVDRGAVPN